MDQVSIPLGGKTKEPKGALTNFLLLGSETTSSEQVLKFAQEWGVLLLCKHQMVAFHDPNCMPLLEDPNDAIQPIRFISLTNASEQFLFRQNLSQLDVWFKEPVAIWIQYARRIRAMIRIFLSLRGDIRCDISKEWAIMRQLEFTAKNGELLPLVVQMEREMGIPIHQFPMDFQCAVLKTVLSMYMKESNFSLHLDWIFENTSLPSQNLALLCSVRSSYQDVSMFSSDHLTLFSVLVAQCISALGPSPFLRVCNCTGCTAHNGNCQELITLSADPGRPASYCSRCKPNIRQQQKSASRKNRRIERKKLP